MMRKTLWALTTRRLDGRSALAVVVRRWKKDVRRDLGGDPPGRRRPFSSWRRSRGCVDDWIVRQPSLVTRKRALLSVVVQRMQIAEGLARNLDRLGLDRKAPEVPSLQEQADRAGAARPAGEGGGDETAPEMRHNANESR